MTDDPFENVLLRKRAPEKFDCRRQLVDIFGVAQPVSDDAGRYDDGRVALQRVVIHVLEAFATFERRLVRESFEG